MKWEVRHVDCRDALASLPDASIDAVVTDPPYAEIDRPYGRLTEQQWHSLMRHVVIECRRILKPSGSAVFILQPNSERVGRMRPWLWEFMAWTAREWNQVQDAWWWNVTAAPTIHCNRKYGLMRPSLKPCIWCGPSDCYRNQDAVLWEPSEAARAIDRSDRVLNRYPSGQSMRKGRCAAVADERGGVTPFNVIPIANSDSVNSGGAAGHGAATPLALCSWWVRYICPPGGIVLDPFCGSGTVGVAAAKHGCSFVGIERFDTYVPIARERVGAAYSSNDPPQQPLFGAA